MLVEMLASGIEEGLSLVGHIFFLGEEILALDMHADAAEEGIRKRNVLARGGTSGIG